MDAATGRTAEPKRGIDRTRRTLATAILVTGLLLAVELVAPTAIAVTMLYSIPVLMASRTGSRRVTFTLAWVCTAAAVASLAAAQLARDSTAVQRSAAVVDELAATLAIWAAATLGLRRARAERALRQTRALSEVTLDSIHEAVITVDKRERITHLNRAATRLTGWSASEARGRPLDDVFPIESAHRGGDDSVVSEGPSLFAGQLNTLKTRDGRSVPVESTTSLIRDDRGNPNGHVVVFRDVSEKQRYETEIKRLAYRDKLTELPNRASFWDRLQLELAHAERDRSLLGLLYLDLDGFKAINDTLGHRAGDTLLRGVAQRLRDAVRRGDTVGRLGGDEFCVIAPGLKDPLDAERVAEKLMRALDDPIKVGAERIRARPSIGIAIYPQDATDAEDLVHCADQAMYEAKHGGRHDTHRT